MVPVLKTLQGQVVKQAQVVKLVQPTTGSGQPTVSKPIHLQSTGTAGGQQIITTGGKVIKTISPALLPKTAASSGK